MIDAGHGGIERGAVGVGGILEKEVALDVAKRVAEQLKAQGYDVAMTRDEDATLSLMTRSAKAASYQADLLVSVHANSSRSSDVQGIETYFPECCIEPMSHSYVQQLKSLVGYDDLHYIGVRSKNDQKLAYIAENIRKIKMELSKKLAFNIHDQVLKTVQKHKGAIVDRKVRKGPFAVLVQGTRPAVIVEVGYITSETEASRLTDSSYCDILARGIVNGIGAYVRAHTQKRKTA